MNSQVVTSREALDAIESADPLRHIPLRCKLLTSARGPIKTRVAIQFPLLSRKERRALVRAAKKQAKRGEIHGKD